jgi:RNA polymerase sigma factor (sigma-70 family)
MAIGPMRRVLRHLRRASTLRDAAELTDGQLLDCFLARREEAAFEALLRRHGPMVLGVCRRVLGNAADAEDAFQATFLVLVRKAHTVRPRELVGHWLHGVAYRTALRARSAAAQRRAKERQVPPMPPPQPAADGPWADVQPLLDRELNGLPEKYRVPIVLCDLEGKPRKEAARQLGWPEGTLSCRLARGRALLARRLARHGVHLTGAALAAGLAEEASATVPDVLAAATTRTALAGAASAGVLSLAEGAIKAMLWTRLKVGAAVVLLFGLAVAGARGLGSAPAGEGPRDVVARESAAPAAGKQPEKPHEVRGQAPRGKDRDEWTLDFRFNDPRLLWVETPDKKRKLVWYFPYQIHNRTGQPRTFIPGLDLVLPEGGKSYPDVVLPQAEASVRKLVDPAGVLDLRNSVTIAATPVPVAKAGDGAEESRHGVAFWEGVPAGAKHFTLFVSGLSNGWVQMQGPDDKPGPVAVRRKTLQLNFKRVGDEMRFVPPAQWIYRATQLRAPEVKGERKGKDAEKPAPEDLLQQARDREKVLRQYRSWLERKRTEQEQLAARNLKKAALKDVAATIESALEQLREQAGGALTEREALDEIERLVKELRQRRQKQREALDKLQGVWALKKLVSAGGPVPPEVVPLPVAPPSAVAILGDRFLTRAGTDPERVPTLRLHPHLQPAGIDFRVGGKVIRGVYELQGDTLRIGLGDGVTRPAGWDPRDGHTLLIYQRKKL